MEQKRRYTGRYPSGAEFSIDIDGWEWAARKLAEKMFDVENGGVILHVKVIEEK